MITRDIKLLCDAQVRRFICEGFLVLPLEELGEDFHADFYRKSLQRQPRGFLTDKTDAAMPQIHSVLGTPTVRGALESLLGPGYIRHPHSGVSVEAADAEMHVDQGWHRDSYWGVQRVHHHRPRWLLCMYYPATVNLDMGPTAIAPGSQYYALPGDGDGRAHPPAEPIRHDQIDDPQRLMQSQDLTARDELLRQTIESLHPALRTEPMAVNGGCFCLFHYDLYHRKMRRRIPAGPGAPPRVMFKLLFTGGRARTAPSWDHVEQDDVPPTDETGTISAALAGSIWSFMLGDKGASGRAVARDVNTEGLTDVLHRGPSEDERMRATYELAGAGRGGDDVAIRRLVDALRTGGDATQRAAMHGLAASGPSAVEPLLAVLADTGVDDHVACCAVHAVGEAVEKPTEQMVDVIVRLSDRIGRFIERQTRAAGGWPAGGGGHFGPSGFGDRSPNPKERQAWTAKLLHATCLQTLGVMGQKATAAADETVVRAVVEQCAACLGRPEPGGGNPDYADDSALSSGFMSRQNAALGLRMLCNDALTPDLRRAVTDVCSKCVDDPDPFLAHYCRDTLERMG